MVGSGDTFGIPLSAGSGKWGRLPHPALSQWWEVEGGQWGRAMEGAESGDAVEGTQ